MLVTALLISVGGHWALLQGAAWTGMFITFAKKDSLAVAFEKTFAGQHPCKLCNAVRKGTLDTEKQHQKSSCTVKKLPLFVEAAIAPNFTTTFVKHEQLFVSERAEARRNAPTAPPPRAA